MNKQSWISGSYQERSNLVSLVAALVVSVPYLFYVFMKYQSQSLSTIDEVTFWATAILLMIPLRIVAEIILYILFSIVRTIVTQKNEDSITDERDKLISLKSTRNSSYAFMIGVMLAILSVVFLKSIATFFIAFIIAGFISELVGIISKIYYYQNS